MGWNLMGCGRVVAEEVPGARCPVPSARCSVPGARCPVYKGLDEKSILEIRWPGVRCPVHGGRCRLPGA